MRETRRRHVLLDAEVLAERLVGFVRARPQAGDVILKGRVREIHRAVDKSSAAPLT
jgi:DNA-binding protein